MSVSILAPSFLPVSAVLEMTYKCNNKCIFCSCPWESETSGYKRGEELTLSEWKECIAKLVDMGVCSFSYTGGEPLLNKHIKEIIEFTAGLKAKHIGKNLEIIEKSPYQFLISNGQLMSEEMLAFLVKFDVNLSMSLPGLSTYNKHTQNGEPETILYWFKRAKELGLRTTVNITATKLNINELYETIANGLISGADTLLLNRFLPGGRGLGYTDLLLDKEEVVKMLDTAEEVLTQANRRGGVGTELPKCVFKAENYVNLNVGTQCSAGIEFFVVGPEGRIRVCNHSPIQLEHYTQIDKIKSLQYWKDFVFKNYLPKMCRDCNLSNQCDGGCREAAHVYRGVLDGNDPLF